MISHPSFFPRADGSIPEATSIRIASGRPEKAAICMGVYPFSSGIEVSAPFLSSQSTTFIQQDVRAMG